MLKKILIALAVIVAVLVVLVSVQPADFKVSRQISIQANVKTVMPYIQDLHRWNSWSIWSKLDPQAKTDFEGSEEGEGAVMKWSGNKEVGEGSLTITRVVPNELVEMRLDMTNPMSASNAVKFVLTQDGEKTLVAMSMEGKKNFIAKAMGLVFHCEEMIGKNYEDSLAAMKKVVEEEKPVDGAPVAAVVE